tara:strand:- start:1680 stop:2831 length:1152 start_codon:yes stop_codon:yes gene_type:complete
MAVKYWIGSTSTDATVASNWSTGALPAQGDIIIFDETAQRDCVGNIATLGGNGIHLQAMKMTNQFNKKIGSSLSAPLVVHANLVEIDRRATYGDLFLDLQETSTAGTGGTSDDGANQLLKLTGFTTAEDKIYLKGRVDEMTISGRGSGAANQFKGMVCFADASATDTGEGVATVRINGNVVGAKVYLGPWGTNPRTIDVLDVAANGALQGNCEVYTFVPTITKISTEPGRGPSLPNKVNIYTTSDSESGFAAGTNTSTQITVGDLVTKRGETSDTGLTDQSVVAWAGTKFNNLSMEGGGLFFASTTYQADANMPVIAHEIAKGTIDENTVINMGALSPGLITITDTASGSNGLQIKSSDCTVTVPVGSNIEMDAAAIATTVSA